MSYTLQRLAPGSYDLILDGAIVGSVVRDVDAHGDAKAWFAELLEASPTLPAPFERDTHEFRTLEDTVRWLDGVADVEEVLAMERS